MKQGNIIITFTLIAVLSLGLSLWGNVTAEKEKHSKANSLINELKPLEPFIGKTWKGALKMSPKGQLKYDISRWERALNGRAVRIIHSVNNGEYGGETIIMWDAQKESLVYFYFTTAGFYTQGTMRFQDGKIISHEKVTGNKNGITEVKAIGEKLADGKMRSKSYYLQNGKWIDGHEVIYEEAPGAEVIFK